jgi:hypothetical protein
MPATNPLPAGPALDRDVCLALTKAGARGWEPEWRALKGEMEVCSYFVGNEDMRRFYEERGYRTEERYQRISTDPATALRALEAMRKMGRWSQLATDDKDWECCIEDADGDWFKMGKAVTPAHAIGLAILAALGEGGSE